MLYTRQEKNSWITKLAEFLESSKRIGLDGIAIYVFGSYAHTQTGRDIDLLIVYDKQVVTLSEALHIRKKIVRQVTEKTGKQTHICLLSKDEPEWLVFVKEENAKIIIKHKS